MKDLELLGWKARDVVNGAEGIVVSVSFDLNGCVMAFIDRGYGSDGKKLDSLWTDTKRVEKIGDGPALSQPTFELIPGGRELPGK